MEVLECIKTRRSIRKFLDVPVEWDKVGQIVDAGRCAPNAGNLQNWKFIVVLNEDTRKKLAEACLQQLWMAKAPVHIIICSEPDKAKRFYGIRGERLYSIQNCAAAVQNMLLTAHSLGLGACWVGAFDEDMIKRAVDVPDYARPQAVIPVGYPAEKIPTPMQYQLENLVFIEKWGLRLDVDEYLGYTSAVVQDMIEKGKKAIKNISKRIKKIK
jgi:nitroreductase